jgi:hypothetical protein
MGQEGARRLLTLTSAAVEILRWRRDTEVQIRMPYSRKGRDFIPKLSHDWKDIPLAAGGK